MSMNRSAHLIRFRKDGRGYLLTKLEPHWMTSIGLPALA